MDNFNCCCCFATKCFFLLLFCVFASAAPVDNAGGCVWEYCVENIEKDERILMQQIRDAKDWALTNGLSFSVSPKVVKCNGDKCEGKVQGIVLDDMAQLVPVSLYPSPFPRELFHEAMNVHKAFQLIYFRAMLASNFDFVKEVHKSVLNVDQWLKNLANNIEATQANRPQPLVLYCNRADYFANEVIDEETKEIKYELKQVEVNGGTVGGYSVSVSTAALHRRMLRLAGIDTPSEKLPIIRTNTMVATALHRAWLEFGDSEAVVLFLHANERNFLLVESRAVQYELERISNFKTKCIFSTLGEGIKRLTLHPDNHSLILDGKFVVAVSVSRNSAATNAAEGKVLREIRRSTAILLNPPMLQMTQSKKMQQALYKPGVVEKFLHRPEEAHLKEAVRKVLTKSWSIGEDEEEAEEIIRRVRERPEKFVMKWNECTDITDKTIFFGEEIIQKLDTMAKEEREKYFIMERLQPMKAKVKIIDALRRENHFVRTHFEPLLNVETTAELGIHGCLLGNLADGTVLDYFWPEIQMRTKLATVDEGGVIKGNSVVDSPYLV